ncbi:MAG: S9 family peptidase [Balneolaceae bacterium]|nr:S9 family peptidase [Balneolaceae bacterium]MCH8548801.1 S9 family peptidase [Balneolaceae bacterium]
MLNRSVRLISITALLLFTSLSYSEAQDQRQTYQSLQHALFSASQLTGDQGPQNVTWIDGGERFSYMEQNPGTGSTAIRVFDPATGEDELLFDTTEHTFPGSDTAFTFRSFQWSSDFKYLIFQTRFSPIYRYSGTADYYYYSIEDETLELVAGAAFTAELSPDGQSIAYHRDGEIYLFELETGEEKQLTSGADEHLYNGRFGWVYEEEFGQVQAWGWSHDSRYIAYWQSDERDVKRFVSTDYEGIYPEYTDIPYPKAGEKNPEVRIGVVDTETGENRWMDLELNDGLIPRIYWTANEGELAVVWMNRQQNHLKLHLFDVKNGTGQMIMEESDDEGWIDVYDFFAGIDDHFFFPEEREEFFWISDRDGYSHIYLYDYEGNLINQVTEGDWEVTNLFAVNTDYERIYFESTEVSPLERHLWSVRFDGSDKRRYTDEEGRHSISMGANGRYFINSWSNIETPKHVELRSTENGGEHLKTFTDNAAVSAYIRQYEYSPRELFSFTTVSGVELDGYLIKPHDFDPDSTYPLIMMVYGGPGAQGVYNEFETNAWYQFLAQQGYMIADINNRGSGGYGRDFEKSVYLNLGINEAEDFAAAADYLGSYSWIDSSRMAIRGHSYGGYMAALTMVLYPRVFRVALVAAPVTDWRLYDTIYTERYMGLPEENRENYINSSVMAHARNMQGSMLVVHSSMDENVHIQNTMQMIIAFTDTGKDVELRIYPPGEHGVAYNQQSYLLLHQVYTNYLNRHLR